MLAFVGALAGGGYLYFRLDDEIRRQVQLRFANHYKNFDVHVGSARFDAERGIAIDNFSLTPKMADGSVPQPILSIDEMYLAGSLRIEQLLTNQMSIDDIVVRHAHMRLVRQADGEWNARALLPLPHFSDQSPKITIEDASATVEYPGTPGAKPMSLQGVNLKLVPVAFGAEPAITSRVFHIEGTANGLPAREVCIDGQLGTANGELDVAVTAAGLDISPDLLANLPASTVARLDGADVAGQVDVTVRLNRQDASKPVGWSAAFKVERGRLAHSMLPDPLTDVALTGHANPQRLSIERLDAKCGSASVMLALNRSGWSANARLAISAKVKGLSLTERLETTLPEPYAKVWKRFRPIGAVDADVRVMFDGQTWKPTLTATCRGITLTDTEKFSYLVEQTTGQVAYSPAENGKTDQLRLDLTGYGGGRPIKIEADLTHLAPAEPQGPQTGEGVAADAIAEPANTHEAGYRGMPYARREHAGPTHPVGFVQISGSDIPLHDQMIEAMPPKAKEFVRSLQAQGSIDFRFRAEWKDLAQRDATTILEIPLKDCRIQYAPFPFPLQHVQGLVSAQNWHWTLNGVTARGSNDSTSITCRGEVIPHDSGCETDLTFIAMNVPLDDILERAIPKPAQQAWNELKPQGNVDFTAHVTRQPNDIEPHFEIGLRPCGQTVSIEPRMVPYRLDKIEGEAFYKRGQVDLKKIRAHHDRSEYSIESGIWQETADGGWQCNLSTINIDRLAADRDLIAALPPSIQAAMEKFQPSGTIGLYKGNVSFAKPAQSEIMTAAWDVSLECQQAAIQGPLPLRGITGGIRLVGRSDGRNAIGAGELALDSILCSDVQLTNIRGPFWANASHCLLGEPACQQQNQPPRRLTADAYGGSLTTNIELVHDNNPSYKVDLHLAAANLARFANERLGGPKDMNGTLTGTLVVSGTGTTTQTLQGSGELHVVDANIYQLPPLVAMLKLLRNRTPDSTAFNRCDMQFDLQGENVHFKQLNLLGDAASLYGNGDVKFNHTMDLVFYTLIGPADLPIPLWKTIAGHVSKQGMQLKVVGTFEHPETERKALPAVNDMLGQIQNEIHDGAASMTESTAAREAHRGVK